MHKSSIKWLSLRSWITNNVGSYLLEQEQKQFSRIVNNPFGDYFMLLGEPAFLNCTDSCKIKNKVILHSHPIVSRDKGLRLSSRQDKLAVKCSSVDAIYLAHCLEMSNNPHEVLREAYRILAPEGTIIITGFNPVSLWGIWRLFAQISKVAPWQAKFLGINKLCDWLALLGFDRTDIVRFIYVPPINNTNILRKFAWLERFGQRFALPFSGAYMIVAKKRILSLTPIPIVFKDRKPGLIPTGLIETNIPPK
jgi:SAM-dependent methyltransferase